MVQQGWEAALLEALVSAIRQEELSESHLGWQSPEGWLWHGNHQSTVPKVPPSLLPRVLTQTAESQF